MTPMHSECGGGGGGRSPGHDSSASSLNLRFNRLIDLYENDWEQLNPIILKLTKLAEHVSIEENMQVTTVIKQYEQIAKSKKLQDNQLFALTRTVNKIKEEFDSFDFDLSLTTAIGEYDKQVVHNLKVITDEVNKVMAG